MLTKEDKKHIAILIGIALLFLAIMVAHVFIERDADNRINQHSQITTETLKP